MRCRTAATGQVGVAARGMKSLPAVWIWSPWLIQTDRLARDVVEERLGRVEHAALHAPELAACRVGLDRSSHRLADQLHPVADPQDRHAQLEDRRIAVGCAGLVDARRAAGEDHRQRVQLADPLGRDVVADDPREGMALADPARDELDVLRTEIQDEYRTFSRVGIRHEPLLGRVMASGRIAWLEAVIRVYQVLGRFRQESHRGASLRRRDVHVASPLSTSWKRHAQTVQVDHGKRPRRIRCRNRDDRARVDHQALAGQRNHIGRWVWPTISSLHCRSAR